MLLTLALPLHLGKLRLSTTIVAQFLLRDFAMLLGVVPMLVGLMTNVRGLFTAVVAILAEVLVCTDVAGSKNIVFAITSASSVPRMFVLRFVRRSWTVVAIVDVETMLTSQMLNDVVATVGR